MSKAQGVTIRLTDAQVRRVVRERADDAGVRAWLDKLNDAERVERVMISVAGKSDYSVTIMRALLVLAAFPTDRTLRTLTEVSKQVSFSASTTHRYVQTWQAVGILEQDPVTRRYRRAGFGMQAAATENMT